ncbi:hypothetical protein KU43P_34190 [Pseudomonas sp. KU43P]|nr:hypothetical protein KU43P_34190 [Pseudomonas sp. KU43P]
MEQIWADIISTSFGGAFAGLTLYGVQLLHGFIRDRCDSDKVYSWMLEQSKIPDSPPFRSTRVIASHNNLTEDRVRYVCSHDERIVLSTGKQEDMWSVTVRQVKRRPFRIRRAD